MRANLAFAAFNVLAWSALVWLGEDLTRGVVARVGHASAVQLNYYVHIPMAVVSVAFGTYALARYTSYKRIALTIQILLSIALIPFLFPYSGGV